MTTIKGNWLANAVLVGGLCAGGAQAATITAVNTGTSDLIVSSITINQGGSLGSVTYNVSNMIGIDITAFASGNPAAVVKIGSSIPAVNTRAALLDGDIDLGTGLANISTATGAMTLNFAQPVVNREGAEIILAELGGNDTFWLPNKTSGATSFSTWTTSVSHNGGAAAAISRNWSVQGNSDNNNNVETLSELETATFVQRTTSTQNIGFMAIDLSDLGYSLGDSISSLSIRSDTGFGLDPLFLTAIPEPASLTLLGAGAVAMLGLGRRQR